MIQLRNMRKYLQELLGEKQYSFITIFFLLINIINIILWLYFFLTYSLFKYGNTPYFAFDKIPGHYNSLTLQLTTAMLFVVSVIYWLNYLFVYRNKQLNLFHKATLIASTLSAILSNILIYPVGALDVFNYIIELKLAFFYHQNPYLITFASYAFDPFSKYAFFNNLPLFYGPVWLGVSIVPLLITGFSNILTVLLGLKLYNLLLILIITWCIYRYHQDKKSPWLNAYLFIANPLLLFEALGNAHNDLLMTTFLILALYALKKKSTMSLPLLTLSVLAKFFSVVALPLFLINMIIAKWRRIDIIISIFFSGIVGIIWIMPYWAGGKMITGLITGQKLSQQTYNTSLFSLTKEYVQTLPIMLHTLAVEVQPVFLLIFIILGCYVVWEYYRNREWELSLIRLYLLFCILVTLLVPWYLIPVLALLLLKDSPQSKIFLFVITLLSLIGYPLGVWAWFNSSFSALQVHLFQALFITLPIIIYLIYHSLYSEILVSSGGRRQ
jgi:alpha-1,6-mannosyltransferase